MIYQNKFENILNKYYYWEMSVSLEKSEYDYDLFNIKFTFSDKIENFRTIWMANKEIVYTCTIIHTNL